MLSFKEQLLEAQINAKPIRKDDSKREIAMMFLRNFIIPKLKNGYTYLNFTYDCEAGLRYMSDSGVMIQSCQIYVPVSTLREAVKFAREVSSEIDAEIKVDELTGISYCFTKKFEKHNDSKQTQKTVSFFEDFLRPKFIKIATLLPDEKEMFCTILLSNEKEAHYVSSIDNYKCFKRNYKPEQIIEAVKSAEKEGVKVEERELNEHTRAIIFSICLR